MTDIYRARELPKTQPGGLDSVIGVDDSTGEMRRFPTAAGSPQLGYLTRADLYADLDHPAGTIRRVTNDPTASYNGDYIKEGGVGAGSWTKATDRVTAVEADVAKALRATGKLNGWPDPFFRYSVIGEEFFGRKRWRSQTAGNYSTVSLIDNPIFDGGAVKRLSSGTTNLVSAVIHLDEIGAEEGDEITIRGLLVGDGGDGRLAGFFAASAGGSNIGSQQSATVIATTSDVPQLATITATVPSGATVFHVFHWTTTSGKTVTLAALWAYKGEADDGPSWPTIPGDAESAYKVGLAEARLDAIEADTVPAVAFAVDSYDAVASDAESVTLDGAAFSSNPRDVPFQGWGEKFTPAGVSFNAVRVRQIEREPTTSAKWYTLGCVVRTGTNSQSGGATVVAVGTVTVRETEDVLTDVVIPLRDQTTGEIITLTDADFADGEYFVGIYAHTRDGSKAACGEPRGTLANSQGQSYYYSSSGNTPIVGTWATNSGNARIGVQHLLLTNPEIEAVYFPAQSFVDELGGSSSPTQASVILPPYVFGVEGRECNVYFDNLFLTAADEYLIDAASSYGKHQNERWTWTPSGALPSGTLTVAAHDRSSGEMLASAVAEIRAAAASAGSGVNRTCLFIGDSLIAAGTITQTLLDNADDFGVTLIGTQGSGDNLHEGHSGWKTEDYMTTGSPFYIGGVVDFPQYLADNSLATPDWVFIHLGINDVFTKTSDAVAMTQADTSFDMLDTLIDSIQSAGAGVKVALMIPSPPSADQDAFGDDYGSVQTRWRFKRNILIWARELIARYAGQEDDGIYVVPSNTALDVVNNMSRAASAPVNSRSSVTAQRQNNGVHPATEGYQQIGDAVWAFLKYYASA